MGFGTDLRGGASHDALVRVQDAEIRFLDTFQHLISMRVENDRKYAAGLGKMLHASYKVEQTEFKDCCSIFKAWDVILKETDSLMRAIKTNADHLATTTSDVLGQLINEKKAARKKYLDERHRLHVDFDKVREESIRHHSEYVKSVERLQIDKAKLMDLQGRGKVGPKLDEAKNKYCRSVVRLHKLHNDYIVSVNAAREHQVLLRESALPAVLDCHQEEQEALVHKTKYILDDFVSHIDLSSNDFQTISQNMKDAVTTIQAGSEYSTAFIELYRSSYILPLEISFDKGLLTDYSGSLKADVIEVNDLTADNLKSRLSHLTEEVNRVKTKIAETDADYSRISNEVNKLAGALVEGCSLDDITSYLEKKNLCENYNRELQESEGTLKKLEKLLEAIKEPLSQLGDGQPPAATDVQDIVGNPETASVNTINTNSSSSSSPVTKDTHFIKSLSKMNPFKKGAGKGGSNSSQNNNEDEDRESNISNDDAHHNSIAEDKAVARKKVSAGYERSETFLANANGSGRNSMMQMREHGQLMDLDHNKAKERIADEEWFHGVLPREEVQRLLVKDGDYLVRESKNKRTNETQFVLSVFWQGHRHFIIQFAPDRGWHFEGQAYPTIQELVRRQFDSGQPVTVKSGAILQTAILREWELLNDDIELQMKIGTGNFGEVYKGLYKKKMEVAVKTCKDTLTEDQKIKFLQEGRILKQYNHPNIVRYIGIAAQKQPVMIVMEFIPKGSLLQFLKSYGSNQTVQNLVQMCVDAASGMEYLESRGCIHRDLAARNCLVGENNIIKISDFGMSREEQEYTVSTGMKQIPVKWTAPEALNFGKYKSSCDVWSFGVLMWEIFSSGRSPYTGMTNARAREYIEQGHRLDSPPNTPKVIYQLMLKCWSYNDDDRPNFSEVHNTLLAFSQSL